MKQLASSEDYPDNRLPVLRQGQDLNWKAADHRRLLRGYLNRASMAYSDTWLLRRKLAARKTDHKIDIIREEDLAQPELFIERRKNAANQPDRSTWCPTTIKLHLLPCSFKLYDLFLDSFVNRRAETAEMIYVLQSVNYQGWHIEAYKNNCAMGEQDILCLLALLYIRWDVDICFFLSWWDDLKWSTTCASPLMCSSVVPTLDVTAAISWLRSGDSFELYRFFLLILHLSQTSEKNNNLEIPQSRLYSSAYIVKQTCAGLKGLQ